MKKQKKNKWYACGLHFECTGCGNCCSGPDEGYIWATKKELKMIADYLQMDLDTFYQRFVCRYGYRYSLIEDRKTKDCIFLENKDGEKRCQIYPVRPNQCRTWPFWASNITSANAWNETATDCPGINRGKLYTQKQIEQQKNQKKWWRDE